MNDPRAGNPEGYNILGQSRTHHFLYSYDAKTLNPLTEMAFSAPSAGKNAAGRELGGHIFVCPNGDDMKKLQDFYVNAGKATALAASHLYTKGNVLVQLDGQIAKALADKYGAAMP